MEPNNLQVVGPATSSSQDKPTSEPWSVAAGKYESEFSLSHEGGEYVSYC